MTKIKKYNEYNETNENKYISLSKDEKNFLWNKMEVRKKAKAKTTQNLVYKQLIENEKIKSESDFLTILNSLEYSMKKKVKNGKAPRGKYENAFNTLQEKLPNNWAGVKYSSLKAKEKRDNTPPSKNKPKKEMIEWLKNKNIEFKETETKEELFKKIQNGL